MQFTFHRIDESTGKIDKGQPLDQAQADLATLKHIYEGDIEAASWMRDDPSLGLEVGDSLLREGVRKLREQRDVLRERLASAEALNTILSAAVAYARKVAKAMMEDAAPHPMDACVTNPQWAAAKDFYDAMTKAALTAKKRIKSKVDTNAVSVESTSLLGLLADIRAAVGDPNGKLMQDELVERCRKLRDTLLFIRDECDWETPRGDFGGGGDERIGPAITAALDWPNVERTNREQDQQ